MSDEKTKDQLFAEKQANMPADELIEKADAWVSDLCTGKRGFTMTVPPSVDDTDMILCELIRRFKLQRLELSQYRSGDVEIENASLRMAVENLTGENEMLHQKEDVSSASKLSDKEKIETMTLTAILENQVIIMDILAQFGKDYPHIQEKLFYRMGYTEALAGHLKSKKR